MGNLEDKYRKDTLSPVELQVLREEVNAMSDNELEQSLYQAWKEEEIDSTFVGDERVTEIKRKIDAVIGKEHSTVPMFIRVGQIAAAVLLPVFIALSVYLYCENNRITSEEMIVSTGMGERANVTLPDGTRVSLNSNSKLGYIPKTYNQEERNIEFSGEAYFRVVKNTAVPFIIDAKGLKVQVLGTTFNLSVRENAQTAELALEEGSVQLLSVKSNKRVTLSPLQKAILDQNTGAITVVSDENVRDASAWRLGNMVFRNTPLSEVLRTIEENYNVSIEMNSDIRLTDQFTGTVPVGNLNEVLEVLEKSYHFKTEITGKIILLSSN